MKSVGLPVTFLVLVMLLAACGDVATAPVISTPTSTVVITQAEFTGTPATPAPTMTVPPTFTPFRLPPTPTSTVYMLPTYTPVPTGSSLEWVFKGRFTFKLAYNRAMESGLAFTRTSSLVLAQTRLESADRVTWALYFVDSAAGKMYLAYCDSDRTLVRVDESPKPILTGDVGLLDPARVMDSNTAAQYLVSQGFPTATPVDTVILQMNPQQDGQRVPAWYLVNSGYSRQVIINAYTGGIIANSFNR